ncbi:hypothetical protein D5086_029189 [Populus alba]|uniref:Dof zinc finger protein n=2 Tax=Populus alba TaxID=43335 RepID=A0A4U5NM27_POPAL|nr:dof zinc finger protein DOF3.5-like [Populus alba]TKR83966.1 dof zinc finger protein DOF3.5 [Populus alba]
METGWKEHAEISPSCPRCGSSNTKFCYHNNYSLTQPRYFCKGCRRYWTKGGSLRNVPVGGGCRKNRRGKSMRLSTDVHSKISGYGGLSNNSIRHPFSHKGISSMESSSSSMIPDGSHIDLALVYAKFLNPQQDSKSGFKVPEFRSEFDPSLGFPTIPNMYLESSAQLPEENGLAGSLTISDFSTEVPSSDNDHLMYYYTLDSAHKHQDHQDRTQQCTSHETSSFHLPPLPGQDTVSQEILWSNSHMMMDNHSLEMSQQPVLGPDTQDPNLLFGNWSPFDMSSDDTFSRS